MKTWHEFLESKAERAEEKTGIDSDHDGERGESKAHQKKVKAAKEAKLAFFKKRKDGAAKIASEARAKGKGPAQLTAWHFAAKAQPYADVIAAIKSDRNESYFIQQCQHYAAKLKFKSLKQEDFQKIMGQLEVWGEAVSELFSD